MASKLVILDPEQARSCRPGAGGKPFLNSSYVVAHVLYFQVPLQDIVLSLNVQIEEIGEPHYDDPSLALLFSQLKSKTLQTAKGTSEIAGRVEFKFVLQIARVFCRMGWSLIIHYLLYRIDDDGT